MALDRGKTGLEIRPGKDKDAFPAMMAKIPVIFTVIMVPNGFSNKTTLERSQDIPGWS
jgi:hypothetical protein